MQPVNVCNLRYWFSQEINPPNRENIASLFYISFSFQLTNTTADFQNKFLIHVWEGIINCRGDGGDKPDSRAQAQGDQHQEEQHSEELRNKVELCEHLQSGVNILHENDMIMDRRIKAF